MRKRTIAGLLLIVGIWWLRRGDEPRAAATLQTAVLADGFALLANKHVVEVDREGNKQHEMKLQLDDEVRFVGTRAGAAVGWKDGKKLALAVLDSDGKTDEVTHWGKSMKQMCDGAATNEYRFGIGWIENDGKVWFVHGPMDRMAGETIAATSVESMTKPTWCGLASAEENVALVWREGARTLMNFCNRKQCTSLVVKVPIDPKDTLLGYGCVKDSCLFATRDKHGTTKLHRVTEKGRTIVKALEHVRPDSGVNVVGAGTRAFAISYVSTDNNATLQRVGVDGALSNVWHLDTDHVPSITWAADKLFVALPSHDAWVLEMKR